MIHPCELPEQALLCKLRESGAYTDCYCTDIALSVSQAQYVEAFYTTWLFKLERSMLALLVSRPSSDLEALALAAGERDSFAAWTVEGRTADQLLMCDYQGRTRSWLMSTTSAQGETETRTRLYFGSAVVPSKDPQSGRQKMGLVFRALLGFHRLYSRALLHATKSRLLRNPS